MARTPCERSSWSAAGRDRPTHAPSLPGGPSRGILVRAGCVELKGRVKAIPGEVGCQGITRWMSEQSRNVRYLPKVGMKVRCHEVVIACS